MGAAIAPLDAAGRLPDALDPADARRAWQGRSIRIPLCKRRSWHAPLMASAAHDKRGS
ncbi:hypothetical protein [Burkholderia sp. 3C]